MSFWWSCPIEKIWDGLESSCKFCPPSSPRPSLVPFSALDSHVHILHSAAESPAKSCWPRWSVFQGGHAQRGSGEGAKHTRISTLHGRRSRWKGKLLLPGVYLGSPSIYLHFYPAAPRPIHRINWFLNTLFIQVFLPNVEWFFKLVSLILFWKKISFSRAL